MDRIIKRYRNRKMYDTSRKEYINFTDIEQMIRDNEPIKVIDNVTGEDITRQILVQLIMRNEPGQSDTRVPLEGLKDMLQNNDGPIFQAFRNVLNIGRGMVQQMTSRPPVGDKTTDDAAKATGSVIEILKGVVEKVSDSALKVVDGTLARELLRVPKREDWKRIEDKLDEIEKKVKRLNSQETEGE